MLSSNSTFVFVFAFEFAFVYLSVYWDLIWNSQAVSYLHICFCNFDLSCPIPEKENFIEMFYIVLFY